jgi:hypothetical protein
MSTYNNSNKDGSDLNTQKTAQNQKEMTADPKKIAPAHSDPKAKPAHIQDEEARKQNAALSHENEKGKVEDRSSKAPMVDDAKDNCATTGNRSQLEHSSPKKL